MLLLKNMEHNFKVLWNTILQDFPFFIHPKQSHALKCNWTELTTRSTSFTRAVSGLLHNAHAPGIVFLVHTGRCSGLVSVLVSVFWALAFSWEWGLLEGCLPSLSFHCFISVTGACIFSFRMGAYGWVGWICQPWEQSPSKSWLPIVEATGCLRHPTSTLRGRC